MADLRGPMFTRCPRCGDKITLQLHFEPYLRQTTMGRSCLIGANVSVDEVSHTCPGPNGE
jgi:hypothetical protein